MTKHAPEPRIPVTVVVGPSAKAAVERLARQHADGNISEMLRRLLRAGLDSYTSGHKSAIDAVE